MIRKIAIALDHAARAAWQSLRRDWAPPSSQPAFQNSWPDIPKADFERLNAVSHLTMTSIERRYALLESIRYIQRSRIPGDIVECGVWRGGSMVLVARALIEAGDTHRNLYLLDTFTGMPPPGAEDLDAAGTPAARLLAHDMTPRTESRLWAEAGLDAVRQNMSATGYPAERLHFVRGKVEETIPQQAPSTIALLRLDTDWYESTRHELIHLYERVSPGGIVIIDDYGCWQGAKKAVDEFIAATPDPIFLHRIDDTGRLFLKPSVSLHSGSI